MATLTKIFAVILSFLQMAALTLFGTELHTVTIQPDREHQTFEGWGTSSCWWSQNVDSEARAAEIAKALYGDEGLGLKIYRYNVGGGEAENPATRIWERSRRTESFLVWNPATKQYEYDFTRDANARRMLDQAIAQGAESVILFCNSPHFSMTLSGQASGGLEPDVSNLPPENYQAFVEYLLTIADWFVAQGYPIAGISPVNEPQWGWGGEWVGQEGCHYSPDETVALLERFAITMRERGVSYALCGPESGEMSEAQAAYNEAFFASDILNEFCGTFSGHSYWMDNNIQGKRASGKRFQSLYPDKKFEMSEWCELPMKLDPDTIDSGLYKANIIVQDLTLLGAVSWSSWTAVNGDGVLDVKDGQLQYYSRYWAYKQFSAFVKEGAKRVEVKDSFGFASEFASVAFTQEGETVLIIVNNSEKAQSFRLKGTYSALRAYTTDEMRQCALVYDGTFDGRQTLPTRSITTFVLAD